MSSPSLAALRASARGMCGWVPVGAIALCVDMVQGARASMDQRPDGAVTSQSRGAALGLPQLGARPEGRKTRASPGKKRWEKASTNGVLPGHCRTWRNSGSIDGARHRPPPVTRVRSLGRSETRRRGGPSACNASRPDRTRGMGKCPPATRLPGHAGCVVPLLRRGPPRGSSATPARMVVGGLTT